MRAVEWCGIMFVTGGGASRGCLAWQDDWNNLPQVPGQVFVGIAILHPPR